jgi:hypothetical protein
VTVHLGTNPFTEWVDSDGLAIAIPPNDQTRLQFLGGGVPVNLIVWGPWGTSGSDCLHTWRWLHDRGYVTAMARLYHDRGNYTGTLPPDPAAYIDSMVEHFQQLEVALIEAKGALLNEWNNEYPFYSMSALVDWGKAAYKRWREVLPAKKLYMPGPAQWNRLPEYVAGLDELYQLSDGIAPHCYFGKFPGDMEPGYEGSPEWWHERYPTKMLWITECANWTARDDVQAMYSRWARLPYVEGMADWKMSGTNDAEFNWTDDHCNVMAAVCKDWRAVRSFPEGTTPVEPPTGSLDRWRLREHVSPQYELCVRMRARVAAGDWAGAASDAKEIEDRAKAIWDEFDLANATP